LILGQSPLEGFRGHADEAVRLYEEMYQHPRHGHPRTAEQAEGIKEMLDLAKEVQATAHEDDEAPEPTEEEERAELDKQAMAADEEEWKTEDPEYWKAMYGEEGLEVEEDETPEEVEMEGVQSAEVEEGVQAQEQERLTTPPGMADDVEMAEQQQSVAQPVEAEDGAQETKMATPSSIGEDVEEQQQVEAEDTVQERKRRLPRISAADRQIIAEGVSSMQAGASGLVTPAATRTATGNDPGGASRRSSRRKSGGGK
jgi:hypothetical protein